ncbi:pancreatic triacylglycerol lipase-like [Tigriopus californicus]|uniref:pancreatic triacylglycerol lipase-like n=1 Tax=Tigriopus californicus TaxID=6832 RepID=UPI0027DA99E1|nr:pancreatic triacylglycerol lipase-like [Tigriopus californicus]
MATKHVYLPLKQSRKRSPKSLWERCKILGVFAIAIGMLLIATDFDPVSSLRAFARILNKKFHEFEPYISRDPSDCFVILWTRVNPSNYQVISSNSVQDIEMSNFNRSWPVKIFVHGFSDTASTQWTRLLKDAYLRFGDYNIFSIDWTILAMTPWYSVVAQNCDYVGMYGSEFINILLNEFEVPIENIHLLGASIGAQAAAHIGYYMNGSLPRLTGLDPSGPLFHTAPARYRLDPSDAQFVDVIHSAGRWVGNDDITGHVDFFPNLGKAPQPGCKGKESVDLSCSHFRAWHFFGTSISLSPPHYYGIKCESEEDFLSDRCCMKLDSLDTVIMGHHTPNTTRGKYYLYTNFLDPKPTIQESTSCKWVTDVDEIGDSKDNKVR